MEYSIGAAVLDGWSITRLLGEGSYGRVFEIERAEFAQTYQAALKVITVPQSKAEIESILSEGMSTPQAEAYFHGIVQELVHEFAIMFKLKGTTNIVSCEDLRVLEHPDGIGWDILIRMELLHPLLQYVYQHPMARRDIIKLGIDICKALELCQRYNIIHRDIKPENIFISDNGDYKLGDFGIARTIERTTSGLSKKGTYSYMAPEVYAGKEYGFSVDTYSLGLVLYRMLNKNRGPFLPQPPEAITFSSREQALGRRISGEPLPCPFYGEGRLGEIVLKACAFDPKERYSSPQQLRQELEAILYTQTDAAVIYPDGDELTMDREPYASARYAAAFGTSTSKSASATQGVFTGDYHTKAEATSEERTQSAFGSEEPKSAGTKKKRKKIGRLIIGIVAAALLVPVVLCVIGAIPIPAAIHNIFVPQTIPEALREYEEAGTLEKLYENGNLSGYQVVAYREDGELDSVQIFDTAGNCVRNELYNSDGTLSHYNLNEYDSSGNCIKSEAYSSDGSLFGCNKFEYDSNGNQIRAESYSSDGTLLGYVLYEYDSDGNETKEEYYDSDGKLNYYAVPNDSGEMVVYNPDGTLYDYDNDQESQTNSDDSCETREDYYDENGELQQYRLTKYDAAGNIVEIDRYDKDDTPIWSSVPSYNSTGKVSSFCVFDKEDRVLSYLEYGYNALGKLIVQRSYFVDVDELSVGSDYTFSAYEYDTAGNVIKEEKGASDSGTYTYYLYYLYSYDGAGNMIRSECYTEDDEELLRYSTYSFDAAGNMVRQENFDGDRNLTGYTVNEFDQQGNSVTSKTYDANGNICKNALYQYDGKYSLVEYQYGDNNKLRAYSIYEYDIMGNVARGETYGSTGELTSCLIYEFDAIGNAEIDIYNPDGSEWDFTYSDYGFREYLIRSIR